MRLDKLLSQQAHLSRSQAAQAVRVGRVTADGAPAREPGMCCAGSALLTLDGRALEAIPAGRRYYMLNKPAGVLCATRDAHEPTVLDLLPEGLRRGLFPAGRLDKDTEGFVLLTDDGALAHRLLAPKKRVPKVYRARLGAPFDIARVRDAFSRPIDLGGGDITSPALLRFVGDGPKPLAELTIFEGRFHQVKRMFATQGLRVEQLSRVAIGGVWLDQALPVGKYRALAEEEVRLLEEPAGTDIL